MPCGLEYMADGAHANVKPTKLIGGLKAQVHTFVGLYWARDKAGTPIEDFLALTPEEFVKYSPESQHQKANDPNNRPTSLQANIHHWICWQRFKRGVKWDPTVFEMIKDIKQWDSWKRTFMADG